MRQRSLAVLTRSRKEIFAESVESQYLVGSFSPSGHSISSHSSARHSASWSSRCATRTRTRAKREDNRSAVPSRHLIVRQACFGRSSASFLAEIGWCLASRRIRVGCRPRPDHGFGGSGPVPGAHTV